MDSVHSDSNDGDENINQTPLPAYRQAGSNARFKPQESQRLNAVEPLKSH